MPANAGDLYRISRDEFLAGEAIALEKSEWVDGVVYAMSGATKAHVRTTMRLAALRYDASEAHGCFIGTSDLMVQTAEAYYYPDVVVSCDADEDPRIERHPCFLAEVLSPSTKRADKHEKRLAYSALESLNNYWIVDPDAKVIEVWTRGEGGWTGVHRAALDVISVQCLGVDLRVVDIVGL